MGLLGKFCATATAVLSVIKPTGNSFATNRKAAIFFLDK
jgi:hypothetical protein